MIELQRLPSTVKLMAVTKGHSVEEINKVLLKYPSIGIIGENRWQEAKEKLPFLPKNIEKHFIGHVQTNKVKEIVEAFDCIESVDSLKLLKIIDILVETHCNASLPINKKYPIFLQVNISNDPNKYGFTVNQLAEAVTHCKKIFPAGRAGGHVELLGLMAITAKQTLEQTRKDFRQLQQLQQFHQLQQLSMGMSGDWEIAVEEGATIIRLGKTLFSVVK